MNDYMPIIQECRVCHSQNLELVHSLGHVAISDFTKTPSDGDKRPLALVYCPHCTLLQLAHNTPRDLLYKDYWYKSSINEVIISDLESIVREAIELTNFKHTDIWIDIGANDGTLLSFVRGFRIGVDPAQNLSEDLRRNCEYAISTYWEDAPVNTKAKVITAIACVYDLPNPDQFFSKIKANLADDGVFICQMTTLSPMIENNDLGNICHEHLEYYSYKSLVVLAEQNNLEVFKVHSNTINGGSYRIYIRHKKNGSIAIKEKEYKLHDYKDFFKRIDESKKQLLFFLSNHKNVYGYGASTKGNTLLQYYGLTEKDLPGILDRNPQKWGLYTVASKIPVLREENREQAEYLWVLPWGFLDSFKKREQDWLTRGGKFVVSTPEFKVL